MCDTPYTFNTGEQVVTVSCGKCPPCKKRRVFSWVFRMKKEQRISCSTLFITLTYDKEHLPKSKNGLPTLRKEHFQKFMMSLREYLRRKYPEKYRVPKVKVDGQKKMLPLYTLKYYVVGEYGGKRYRPHYHLILFNYPLEECHKIFQDKDGNIEYISKRINKAWKKGSVHIAAANGATMAYCLKYIDKKRRIPMFKGDDRLFEYANMSKGLGKNYLSESVKRWHKNRLNDFSVKEAGMPRIPMPRYYVDKIYDDLEKLIRKTNVYKMHMEKMDYQRIMDPDFENNNENARFGRYNKFYKRINPRDYD